MASAPKRVAHVIGASRGGIRRHVRYLAAHPPDGYQTLAIWGPGDLRTYFSDGPFVARPPVRGLPPVPDADVVHAHGFAAGRCALRRRRPPVVLTVHTDLSTQGRTARSLTLRRIARIVADRADAIIAVSERTARHFAGAHVIAPAVDPLPAPRRSRHDVRAELGTPDDRVVVVAVARLHADKGLDVFIDAVSRTGAEGWICGDGPLAAELAQRAAGTAVRLLGYRDDISDILGAADMFALPSVGEAYGIAVVEAIGAGLPVVVSEAGAMPEIAGEAGVIVSPGDRAAFGAAVERLVTDGALRAGLAARARLRGFADPAALVQRIGDVYDEVTS